MRQNEQTLLGRAADVACSNDLNDLSRLSGLSGQGNSNRPSSLNVWILRFVLPETRWMNARL